MTTLYPTDNDITTSEVKKAVELLKNAIEAFYGSYNIGSKVDVTLAPVAAEFKSPSPYRFPQGAYSTVDALLDKAYARDEYLTILPNTEVLSVSYHTDSKTNTTDSLTVRTLSNQQIGQIDAKGGVILCAGTVGTAKIALNSGISKINSLVGKGLTDHEIWGVRFLKGKDENKKLKDPLKLQSEITICGVTALLNVVVNANTFLGSGSASFNQPTQYFDKKGKLLAGPPSGWFQGKAANSTEYDTVNVTLEYSAELLDTSEVLNTPTPNPVIYARRPGPRQDENSQKEMQDLATEIRDYILDLDDLDEPAPRLSLAGFGLVAHEVGTMRLQIPGSRTGYVVEDSYQVRNFQGLYVCDLSIFPVSPPANPSLTLAALSLQLANDLVAN